jgi:hypothetical protein
MSNFLKEKTTMKRFEKFVYVLLGVLFCGMLVTAAVYVEPHTAPQTFYRHADVPATLTIPDNGGPTYASYSVATPTKAAYQVTCSDPTGCYLYFGETNLINGEKLTVENVGSATVNITDVAGVREMASAVALGQYDTITFMYMVDRWVELGRSNN